MRVPGYSNQGHDILTSFLTAAYQIASELHPRTQTGSEQIGTQIRAATPNTRSIWESFYIVDRSSEFFGTIGPGRLSTVMVTACHCSMMSPTG
jgi:hypothetical protein